MEREAYERYASESQTWLKRARLELIRHLCDTHVGAPGGARRILEIGAGVGQNAEALRGFGTVDALEVDPIGIAALEGRDDIGRLYTDPIPTPIDARWDVIGAFDVIEHLPDDREAADWLWAHLTPGGVLLVTVPAYGWMFSEHDVALGHYRRYTRKTIDAVFGPRWERLDAGYFVGALFPLAAASRIPSITRVRLGRSRAGSKQSGQLPVMVDSVFSRVMRAELRWLRTGRHLPWGLTAYLALRRAD